MRRQRAFALVFAVCCLFVLTSLSASLESTVSGTPDDALDLDFGSLPLTVEEATELKETYESGPGGDSDETADTSQSDPQSSDRSESESVSDSSDSSSESSAESGSDGSGSAGGGPSQNEGETPGTLGLLASLLATLRGALPALFLLAGALLAVHQRDRLLAWLETRLEMLRSAEGDATADAAPEPAFRPPANRIERAWAELLSESDVNPDPSATPRECAEMLIRAGFDGDAVRELATMFEEVRYDDAPVTTDREERALHCLHQSTSGEVAE